MTDRASSRPSASAAVSLHPSIGLDEPSPSQRVWWRLLQLALECVFVGKPGKVILEAGRQRSAWLGVGVGGQGGVRLCDMQKRPLWESREVATWAMRCCDLPRYLGLRTKSRLAFISNHTIPGATLGATVH